MNKVAFFLLLLTALTIRAADLPNGFVEIQVAQNLDPTDMLIAPDGRIFVMIKSGKILIVENGALLTDPFLNIENQVDNFNERGLGHMVLDPDFEINRYYYVYYTIQGENRNRVSRFTAIGNFTVPGSEQIILNLNMLSGTIHNAGAMVFGHDRKLYIATGEGADPSNSQAKNSLLGKILRINPDGTIPDDNPFVSDTTFTGINKAIWALGFRNPYSMSIDPVTGKIYANDVGGVNFEEVNEVLKGRNYGWPIIEGMRTNQAAPADYQDPVYAYPHGGGLNAGCAIVGSAFYSFEHFPSTAFPVSFHGRYFFADYCSGYIRMIDPATKALIPEVFATGINRPLAIGIASDGSLYYLARAGIGGGSTQDNTSSTNGSLWRVMYTGSGEPIISVQPQSVLIPIGEDATFTIAASGNQPLAYQWQKDDEDIPGATSSGYTAPNVQIIDDNSRFRCVVSNAFGTDTSKNATLNVTTNTRPSDPEIVVTLPNGATLYQAGHLMTVSGTATDAEDGELDADALSWKIDFHHDNHTHPALGWISGVSTLEYNIPIVGETSHNVWLRVYLRATDSEGLSKTSYAEIFPQKAEVTVLTDPPELNIKLDGMEVTTPHIFTSVVGQFRTVEALPFQKQNGYLHIFDSWMDDEAEQVVEFQVPEGGRTITASYISLQLGDGVGLEGNYYSNQIKTFLDPPTLTRVDSVIDFNWVHGSPDPSISADFFTVRWMGEILPPVTDTYNFHVVSDDGIRLWVNDQMIIDQWIDQGPTEWTGNIDLEGQEKYPIKIEYYENSGGAVIQLYWSSVLLPRQIIPAGQLFNDLTTGIEGPANTGFVIYPTIASHYITITTERPQRVKWVIYNLMGQKMATGELNDPVTTVEVSGFPPGMYFFQGSKNIIRFIKQ